jgi:hypothetical protein
VVEDLGSGRGESQQERYPHRGAGATPVMSSHVLEAIQDAVADFFARVGGWANAGFDRSLAGVLAFTEQGGTGRAARTWGGRNTGAGPGN